MRRSLGHLLNREQSRGFCAWVLMARERAAALDAMRRGLLFMLKRTLALGFASWSGRSGVVGVEPMSKALDTSSTARCLAVGLVGIRIGRRGVHVSRRCAAALATF